MDGNLGLLLFTIFLMMVPIAAVIVMIVVRLGFLFGSLIGKLYFNNNCCFKH